MRLPLASLVVLLSLALPAPASASALPAPIETIHKDLWTRFVQPNGLLLDYNTPSGNIELPTAAECLDGKPNALAWWTPVENGTFFTGIYLDAAVRRWQLTGAAADRAKAGNLARGLLLAASVSDVPGFVARNVSADGKSHYAIGSDDQTAPWFQGLWSYVRSGAAPPEEKAKIEAKMVALATTLRGLKWYLPCDSSGGLPPGQIRGTLAAPDFRSACRQLFITRIVYEITRDSSWLQAYENALTVPTRTGKTMLDYVEAGLPGLFAQSHGMDRQLWISVNPQAMLRALVDLESRPAIREKYLASLRLNAVTVAPRIVAAPTADVSLAPMDTDWRALNAHWHAQATVDDAVALALSELGDWKNHGRNLENSTIREPLCAAAIALLAPGADADLKISGKLSPFIARVPWTSLRGSFGFFAEYAWLLGNPPHH